MGYQDIDLMIGQKIRAERIRQGMTVGVAARLIGISQPELERVEAGKTYLDAALICQFSLSLKKPIAWFYGQQVRSIKFPLKRG